MNYKSPEEKYEILETEMKDYKNFKSKLFEIYRTEFENKIEDILNKRESEFMKNYSKKINLIIEDEYSNDCFENVKLIELMRILEKDIYENFYKKNYKILSDAYKDYTEHHQNNFKFKMDDNFLFRKHCRYTDDVPRHNCIKDRKCLAENSEFIKVYSTLQELTHVICKNCKKCYFSNCILLECSFCTTPYYTSIENVDNYDMHIQPATWEKYHCSAIFNYQMRCIECQDYLYLNLKENILQCFNCRFQADPSTIFWICVLCNKEFKSNAKIYNALEYKLMKDTIKDALLNRIPARPKKVPCCDINIETTNFYHKRECNGKIYLGRIDDRTIIICEKCKSVTNYNKFIWTCTNCKNRFKSKDGANSNKDIVYVDKNLTNENNISTKSSYKQSTNDIENLLTIDNADKEELNSAINMNYIETTENSTFGNIYSNKPDTNSNNSVKSNASNENFKEPLSSITKNLILNLDFNSSGTNLKSDSNSNNVQLKMRTSNSIRNFKSITSCKNYNNEVEANPLMSKNRRGEIKYVKNSLDKEKNKLKQNSSPNTNTNLTNLKSSHSYSLSISIPVNYKPDINNISNQQNSQIIHKLEYMPLEEINSDDYIFCDKIGEGSYGFIYEVSDKNENKFAMKKIIIDDKHDEDKITKEFFLMNSLKHENIVNIYGISFKKLDITTSVIYILMDLAINDLEKDIQRRAAFNDKINQINHTEKNRDYFGERELITMLKQLCSALSYMQAYNISHHDIKPQNILLFNQRNIFKLTDFGEATDLNDLDDFNENSNSERYRGTEIFMSPILFYSRKNFIQKKEIKHNYFKSDCFSLGLCLFYAATMDMNALYEIRKIEFDIKNPESIQSSNNHLMKILKDNLIKRYSKKFIYLLSCMLDFDEQTRLDFIELNERLRIF